MSVVVMAHHTPDLYGSDRQLLESVSALTGAGHRVVVTMPRHGPLSPLLRERGAELVLLDVPVLRKALLTPTGLVRLAWSSVRALGPAVLVLRRHRADLVYVNTVIIPIWLLAARLARVPALVHVHEAFTEGPRLLRALLVSPLLLAARVVVNSEASRAALGDALGPLSRRATVVHNGVPGPPQEPGPPTLGAGRTTLALVGRLSPNKGIDVAVDAVALLTARGYDVDLHVAGTEFPGYEWYAEDLRRRAERPDLAGRVHLLGYVHPTWDLLARSGVVLVPSRTEPFGNTAVEAQLAGRPVVASRVQGLPEVLGDGGGGVLVAPEDPVALADAVAALLDEPDAAAAMGRHGRAHASVAFSTTQYARRIMAIVNAEILD